MSESTEKFSFLSRWSARKHAAKSMPKAGELTAVEARSFTEITAAQSTGTQENKLAQSTALEWANSQENELTQSSTLEWANTQENELAQSTATIPLKKAPLDPQILPDIETLDANSDFLPFMAEQVSPQLRKLALQKLFHDPKYNVIDALNDYLGDYTQFTPLGDVLTADQRFQIARKAAALVENAENPPQIQTSTPSAEGGYNAMTPPISDSEVPQMAVKSPISDSEAPQMAVKSPISDSEAPRMAVKSPISDSEVPQMAVKSPISDSEAITSTSTESETHDEFPAVSA